MFVKKLVLTFACVACCVAEAARPAAAADELCRLNVPVELTGKLRYIVSNALTHERLFVCDTLPEPLSRSWHIEKGLTVGGTTYRLNIGADLAARVEQLMGKNVVVAGDLLLDTLTVREVKLYQPGSIKKTVNVEIRGTLHWNKGLRCLSPEFEVLAGGVCREAAWFELDFGANPQLRTLARSLDGQTVIVRGVRQGPGILGESILVTSLKTDDITYVRETVTVEITGRLRQQRELLWLGPRPMDCQPENFLRRIRPVYRISAVGKTYELDVSARPELQQVLPSLCDRSVIVTGTLDGEVVRVTSLKADPEEVLLHGTLRRQPGEGKSNPPVIVWEVVADGKVYPVEFVTEEMKAQALRLAGQPVVIHGTRKGSAVLVTELRSAVLAVQELEGLFVK
jgi:hypothetical protein